MSSFDSAVAQYRPSAFAVFGIAANWKTRQRVLQIWPTLPEVFEARFQSGGATQNHLDARRLPDVLLN